MKRCSLRCVCTPIKQLSNTIKYCYRFFRLLQPQGIGFATTAMNVLDIRILSRFTVTTRGSRKTIHSFSLSLPGTLLSSWGSVSVFWLYSPLALKAPITRWHFMTSLVSIMLKKLYITGDHDRLLFGHRHRIIVHFKVALDIGYHQGLFANNETLMPCSRIYFSK